MQIPVNKNIDSYKDDFFRGLSMRETVTAGAMLLSGVAGFLFFYGYVGMPQTLAMYCMLLLPFLIGLAGFIRIDSKSLKEYLEEKKKVKDIPVYYFCPGALEGVQTEPVPKEAGIKKRKPRERRFLGDEDGSMTEDEEEHERL